MSALTAVSPQLLAAALADAHTQLAAAEATDTDNHLALVASHATLEATLRRVLWVLEAEARS